jgi:molecular chaperone GrpE
MSGDPSQDDNKPAADVPPGAGDVLPVEVDAPEPAATKADEPKAEAPPEKNPVAELEAKLAAAEKEKKDNYDKYLRTAADIENMRKRQKRELEDAKTEQKFKVLKEMLPVVDNLERAIEHAGKGDEKNAIIEGLQLVLRQFSNAFERLDVQTVDALDHPFDPNQHEAISQLESDKAPGTVVQVLQRGYKSGDRLLRPALVVVAKAKAQAE